MLLWGNSIETIEKEERPLKLKSTSKRINGDNDYECFSDFYIVYHGTLPTYNTYVLTVVWIELR